MILDKILKLLGVLHAFLSLVVAKLSDLKYSLVFWPTLYVQHYELEYVSSVVYVTG